MRSILSRLILLSIYLLVCNLLFSQVHVHLVVKAPAKHADDTLYVAGNFNNWAPDEAGSRFSTADQGTHILDLNLPKGKYEYKITRGSWTKVETTAKGGGIGNHAFTLGNDTTLVINVEAWQDDFPSTLTVRKHTASKNVAILDTAFFMPQLNRTRRIWAYIPADYKSSKKKYPVLYMHDGQALFDEFTSAFGEWGIDECLDTLFAKGGKECIVIGIDNSPVKRMNEYNPYEFRKYGKGEGNEYVDFLVKTLKPYVDQHFRTLKGKEHTFIAGSSMGGLISLVAVMRYPEVYGGVGIFSPAFWTAPMLNSDLKTVAPKINGKLYFYAGGSESDEMVPDMKKLEGILRTSSRVKLFEVVDEVQKHNEAAWRKHFPEFIKWILK